MWMVVDFSILGPPVQSCKVEVLVSIAERLETLGRWKLAVLGVALSDSTESARDGSRHIWRCLLIWFVSFLMNMTSQLEFWDKELRPAIGHCKRLIGYMMLNISGPITGMMQIMTFISFKCIYITTNSLSNQRRFQRRFFLSPLGECVVEPAFFRDVGMHTPTTMMRMLIEWHQKIMGKALDEGLITKDFFSHKESILSSCRIAVVAVVAVVVILLTDL